MRIDELTDILHDILNRLEDLEIRMQDLEDEFVNPEASEEEK